MARMDRAAAPPPLVPTGTKVGWRRPAVVLAAILLAVVGVTQFGAADQAPLTSSSSAGPTLAAGVPAPTVMPAPTTAPASPTTGRISGAMPRSGDGLTYADGIPTGISGESVYRVRDALLVPVGRTLLVGGWYQTPDCRQLRGVRRCPSPTLSDVPLDSPRTGDVTTTFVALDDYLVGRGARILLATVEPDPLCLIRDVGACLPRLRVLQQIWSGTG